MDIKQLTKLIKQIVILGLGDNFMVQTITETTTYDDLGLNLSNKSLGCSDGEYLWIWTDSELDNPVIIETLKEQGLYPYTFEYKGKAYWHYLVKIHK